MTERPGRPAILAALLLLLASCAKEPASDSPRGYQLLRAGNGSEPQDIDPQTVTGIPEFRIIQALIEGLATPDPVDQHPVPGVASSWEISDDGLVYTFHLRPDARWTDGSPVTSEDFLLAWKRILSPKLASEFAYLVYDYVKGARDYHDGKTSDFATVGMKAPDSRTLVVTLDAATPYLIKLIASHDSWDPLPIHTLRRFGALDARSTPWTRLGNFVGNGPFMLKEWIPHQKIAVVRSPTYWDASHVKLDEIDFIPVDDEGAEERMFRTGQLDWTESVPISKIEAYRSERPELIHTDPYLAVYFYRCNVTRPPLDDWRVRRALALAIDREQLIRDVLHGHQVPAYSVSYPNNSGYTSHAQIRGSLEEARRLLAEAGYPGGRGMPRIELLYNTSESHRQIAEAIQEMWRERLGVGCDIVNQEWKVFLESVHTGNFQLARAGWASTYADPSVFLEIWAKGNGNNDTQWSNPEYDRLLRQSLTARNDTERFGIYQRMDEILVDECPVLPIFYYTRSYLLSPKVKGFWPNALDNHPYKAIYLRP
jgi:oligopeptide transport system substrate-binding protein